MKNWAQIFSLALFKSNGQEIGSDEQLVGTQIIADGNLMVRTIIETQSKDRTLKTQAIYSYYYSPNNNRRIFVDLKHESLKSWTGNSTYAYIMFFKSSSRAIQELNIGTIFPFTHLSGQDGIEEYNIETNPESSDFQWMITSKDNVFLGDIP